MYVFSDFVWKRRAEDDQYKIVIKNIIFNLTHIDVLCTPFIGEQFGSGSN